MPDGAANNVANQHAAEPVSLWCLETAAGGELQDAQGPGREVSGKNAWTIACVRNTCVQTTSVEQPASRRRADMQFRSCGHLPREWRPSGESACPV